MVSKNMVVEIGGVMACDGGKGMMGSMQMDKEEELLQQQPKQQQPQTVTATWCCRPRPVATPNVSRS